MNNINISGRLTATPELKQTQSGVSVTAFTVAVDREYRANKEKQTDFINCVAWQKTAEFVCRNFEKGKGIEVTGSLNSRKYEDKNGNKREVWEIMADKVGFTIGGNKPDEQSDAFNAFKAKVAEITADDSDDLPF